MIIRNLLLAVLSLLALASCSNDDDLPGIIITPVSEETEDEDNQDTIIGDILVRTSCENGFASIYPCNNYDLMSRLTIETLNTTGGNDIWGWTDPLDGKEYAIVGTRQGTVFIDISNPEQPLIIGTLLTATADSTWRDIKVYNNHAFIVSEAANHGMQIFDLTRLRNPDANPQTFDADAQYTDIGNAHNIVINEDSGYAYAVGTATFNGGAHFINIQDPVNPLAAGGYEVSEYTHDAQVVTYNGPDTAYQGQEIFIGCNENEVVIVNVTDKENPSLISTVTYPDTGYVHQGWLSEDHSFYYANDELDESQFGFESRTLVFDFTDLDNPFFASPFFGPTQAIDHNLYTHNNELFLSNYTAGLRVASIENLSTPVDIGFFDTFPENDNTEFNGVWSVYPFFESGNIIINDVSQGLFIVRKSGT